MLEYKLEHVKGRMGYEEMLKTCIEESNNKIHMGQLKLLMTEIMFLSKVAKDGDVVLYIGAAPGYHINYLIKLFPNLQYELWDGKKSEVEQLPNVKIYRKFFLDDDALDYSKLRGKILLISDIRNLRYRNEKMFDKERDIVVDEDMNKQIRWCQKIKPKYAFLKFRFMYAEGKTMYFPGKIYLQPYGPIGAETRLLTNKYDESDMIEYDNVEHDERNAYFSCNIRFKDPSDHTFDETMDAYKIKKIWDNYIAFYTIESYFKKHKNIEPTVKDIAELFIDMVEFLKKRYFAEKYNYLYSIDE